MAVPIERRAIEAIIRVGSYERAITSEDQSGSGTWRAAAKPVAKDLTAWGEANRQALTKASL